jgi:hypothetical protein
VGHPAIACAVEPSAVTCLQAGEAPDHAVACRQAFQAFLSARGLPRFMGTGGNWPGFPRTAITLK